ncbi:MAG: signal recognition particle-docking protein FtsY [Clostridia bacterium]|jgi:fused signal recognition particle receptor|nr:signal recognition particle-docking protein FtsY [Clostridia bacterium]
MFFSKLKENLKKTKEALDSKLSSVFNKNKGIEEIIDEIEEILILSDVGMTTSVKICDNLRSKMKSEKDRSEENFKIILKNEIVQILDKNKVEDIDKFEKQVILVVGVNGVGKTTSIGKLANLYKSQGKRVLLAAADTFRAGAIEQIDIWAKRADVSICLGKDGQDPASVVFDATKTFASSDFDVLICDTAGRLHNKKNLMDELEKIKRTINKNLPDICTNVYIVVDSTTGQNATVQVKNFYERTSVNGIILTKLDSTAKGGIVINIVDELGIPVKYIGVGEQIDDIEVFDSKKFVDSII